MASELRWICEKTKIAPRHILKRQGNFGKPGMNLAEKDKALLHIIQKCAEEPGYTPLISEVPQTMKIKGRFRCWRDALYAAGLPSEKSKEQVELRKESQRAK